MYIMGQSAGFFEQHFMLRAITYLLNSDLYLYQSVLGLAYLDICCLGSRM